MSKPHERDGSSRSQIGVASDEADSQDSKNR